MALIRHRPHRLCLRHRLRPLLEQLINLVLRLLLHERLAP